MAEAPYIWLTRPREDSEALAALLAEHGIASLIAPVIRIEPLTPPLPDITPTALLLTSRHACHILAQLPNAWRALPTYCVGAATAAMARAAGCIEVIEGDSDVLALLPQLASSLPAGSTLLYLAGEDTRADIATLLQTQHIRVEKITCYQAIAETTLAPDLQETLINNRLTGTVFFSPRSAQLAHALLTAHGMTEHAARMDAYCLSLAVAEAAGSLPWRTIRACHVPTLSAMIDLIVS